MNMFWIITLDVRFLDSMIPIGLFRGSDEEEQREIQVRTPRGSGARREDRWVDESN